MRVKIFTIISMLFLGLTNVPAEEKDISISNESLSNSCLTTIDINITENLALKDDLIIDYDYGKIRREGVFMNVYYSNAIGRAQWTDFPSPTNIYLMPSSILVPINRWIKNGMKTNGTWWVRIVLLRGGNC